MEPTLLVLGAVLLLVTVLPISRSKSRWIRIWDFPRVQIAPLLLVTIAAVAVTLDLGRAENALFLAALALAFAYHAWRIFPYTPLHSVEAVGAEGCDGEARLRLLVANVLKENREARPLLDLVRRCDPDVVLLVETDAWWDRELDALAGRYPHAVRHPRDNAYGMHLLSKLEIVDPEVRFLVKDDVPSIHAGVRLRSGEMIDVHAVHPVPPPYAPTRVRDAELLAVARLVRGAPGRAIVAGDLNDVAWSRTTRLFQRVSGLLDPRIGRGLHSTFDANSRWLRWPLDHVFHGDEFAVLEIETMDHVGSDHFPFRIDLCHRPRVARRQSAPDVDAEHERRARRVLGSVEGDG